jgi:DNA-binding IclR family transcriptional regulator
MNMIKVIGKTVDIISLLSTEKQLPLREIARLSELNKTTVGNIVSTLKNSGWLSQNDKGEYRLSEAFFDLSRHYVCGAAANEILETQLKQLALKINEHVMCAELRHGERHVMMRIECDQAVMINGTAMDEKNIYNSATGRILVAYLSDEKREELFALVGKPTKEEWPEAASDECKAYVQIRQNGFGLLGKSDYIGLAVPVFNRKGNVWATLGVYLPLYRFDDEKQKVLLRHLKGTAEIIAERIP